MRIWFDTEFIEDGRTIDLISIGLIKENGDSYYAESSEVDWSKSTQWIDDNVVPYLIGGECEKSRNQIANEIIDFVGADRGMPHGLDSKVEFWAYYADYDWIVLCQLYGRMIDLPGGWPMYCRDLKQLADMCNTRLITNTGQAHHALADASWNREAHLDLEDRIMITVENR